MNRRTRLLSTRSRHTRFFCTRSRRTLLLGAGGSLLALPSGSRRLGLPPRRLRPRPRRIRLALLQLLLDLLKTRILRHRRRRRQQRQYAHSDQRAQKTPNPAFPPSHVDPPGITSRRWSP